MVGSSLPTRSSSRGVHRSVYAVIVIHFPLLSGPNGSPLPGAISNTPRLTAYCFGCRDQFVLEQIEEKLAAVEPCGDIDPLLIRCFNGRGALFAHLLQFNGVHQHPNVIKVNGLVM